MTRCYICEKSDIMIPTSFTKLLTEVQNVKRTVIMYCKGENKYVERNQKRNRYNHKCRPLQ